MPMTSLTSTTLFAQKMYLPGENGAKIDIGQVGELVMSEPFPSMPVFFWNDADGFHIYRFKAPDGKDFTAGQAKVDANFHAMVGNTLFISEAFNVPYPADRIELLKRISPPTMDVSYPVDLFVRRPARIFAPPWR